MTVYATINWTVSGGVARLTLNRPDRLNAFSDQMHAELRDAVARAVPDGGRVLVLTGAGRAFCAGQDLRERGGGRNVDLGESIRKNYAPLVHSLRALPLPVIAAVNGVAAGAGANVALACDLVIAARSARFIQPFSRLGLIPDAGGTATLPRAVGLPRALGLALLGEPLTAEQAEDWGLIWKCFDDVDFPGAVDALALRLASGPTLGFARTKQAMYGALGRSVDTQMKVEQELQRELGNTGDYSEGVAAFLERREPRFRGS